MSLPIYIKSPLSLVVFFTTNQGIPCPSSRQRAAARFTRPGRINRTWGKDKDSREEKGKRKSPAASRDHSLNSKCIT